MIEKRNGQRFGTEITIYIFWILASSRWYFWTKMGRKSRVDFWKLDRDVFFDLTYQVCNYGWKSIVLKRLGASQSHLQISMLELAFLNQGFGINHGFDQEGDLWSKNKYHQSIRNRILRLERSLELQKLHRKQVSQLISKSPA